MLKIIFKGQIQLLRMDKKLNNKFHTFQLDPKYVNIR